MRAPRLGPLQRQVLVELPTISVTAIAERLDVTRPSASRALSGLAELGLVESAGESPWRSAWRRTVAGDAAVAAIAKDGLRDVLTQLERRPVDVIPKGAEKLLAEAEALLRDALA